MRQVIFNKTVLRQFNPWLAKYSIRYKVTQCLATSTRISKHLTLHKPVNQTVKRGQPQTLALMFPCPHTPDTVISKYSNLYLDRDVNVLCITSGVRQYLSPLAAKAVANEILDYLATNETPLSTDRYLVHTLSLGTYMYGVMLMEIFEKGYQYSFLQSKIRGQVFDSFIYGREKSVASMLAAVLSNSMLSGAMRGFAFIHGLLAEPQTKGFYEKVGRFIETAPIHSPVLFYHSLNDPLCDSTEFHRLMDQWSNKDGLDLHIKCWHHSKHAQHFQEHPREYLKAMQSYLEKVGVPEICH